jgi:adenosylhomocysteine nucleosidase
MKKSLLAIFTIHVYLLYFPSLGASTAKEIFAKNELITIGIITAVAGEAGALLELMEAPISQEKGGRVYHQGKLQGIKTVLVSSRIGKVAAAATTTHLILEYHVDLIIFTGVAGALDSNLNVGDVVIAHSLLQHDMDARPFCPIYEIPLLKIKEFIADPLLEDLALLASKKFIEKEIQEILPSSILNEFNITAPKVVKGLVLTGDKVIAQEVQKIDLKKRLPEALCVEMEGASVGQVCYEYGVPVVVIRTISDYANQRNPGDVKNFIVKASGLYSVAIIKNIYALIEDAHKQEK